MPSTKSGQKQGAPKSANLIFQMLVFFIAACFLALAGDVAASRFMPATATKLLLTHSADVFWVDFGAFLVDQCKRLLQCFATKLPLTHSADDFWVDFLTL